VSAIVSDNAPNAISGSQKAASALASETGHPVFTLRCLPHILHLVASEGLDKVTQPIVRLKNLVSHLRRSTTALAKLEKFCVANDEPFHKPKTDVPTRWNSTWAMINSMTGMRVSLKAMQIVEKEVPTEDDWERLTNLAEILKTFEDATKILSKANTCTLSRAHDLMITLTEFLKKHRTCKDLGVEAMLEKFEKYATDVGNQSLLPSFLDPRYVTHMPAARFKAAQNLMKQRLVRADDKEEEKKKEDKSIFELAWEDNFYASDATKGYPELAKYVGATKIDPSGDPLLWWKENAWRFPTIAAIAREQLAMLASSVPSEEAFSAAAQVITDRRNSLGPEKVRALMVTRAWLRFNK